MTIARAAALLLLLCSLGAASAAQQAQPPAQPPAPPATACTGAQHRQFDFWVGRWEVYSNRSGQRVADSLIERLYDGCAIRENWMPLQGAGGGSLNAWRPGEGVWRQVWVDSSNGWALFEGGIQDGAMVLTGVWPGATGPGSTPLVRIRYSREEGGAVRQFGEASTDEGATWRPIFDLIYRPAAD